MRKEKRKKKAKRRGRQNNERQKWVIEETEKGER